MYSVFRPFVRRAFVQVPHPGVVGVPDIGRVLLGSGNAGVAVVDADDSIRGGQYSRHPHPGDEFAGISVIVFNFMVELSSGSGVGKYDIIAV